MKVPPRKVEESVFSFRYRKRLGRSADDAFSLLVVSLLAVSFVISHGEGNLEQQLIPSSIAERIGL